MYDICACMEITFVVVVRFISSNKVLTALSSSIRSSSPVLSYAITWRANLRAKPSYLLYIFDKETFNIIICYAYFWFGSTTSLLHGPQV